MARSQQANPCRGKKQDGSACTNTAHANGYCGTHVKQAGEASGTKQQAGGASSDKQQAGGAKTLTGPKGARRQATDGDGRIYAESLAGKLEDIAKGYGVGKNNALLVVKHGQMADDWKSLRAAVPNIPGNYIWTVRAPGAKNWVPVYCGEAGGNSGGMLKARFASYINRSTFGPEKEMHKHWAMVDMMSRGFSIEVRFRTDVTDAMASENSTLQAYNFALNTKLNGTTRAVMLPGGKTVGDYAVLNKELAAYASVIKQQLAFQGKM